MVGAIVQSSLQADQRVSGENALDDRVAQALFDGGEEVFGDGAAEDFLGEDHVVLLILRLEADPNVTELAGTAGLLLVTAVCLDLALDLLAVCDAGGLEFGLDIVEVLELGAENADLDIACAGNDHLVSLGVVDESEGDVLLVELCKTRGDLVVLTLGLG